ncbi:MAG: hypothetical protein COX78_04060, partial [Candidatus Levybacteria bacterium CG_4_10_14_0_2_um_filter_35_8]
NVPILKQTSSPWKFQVYDSANRWAPTSPTINSWGCALTSAAMILRYYGINKMTNESDLDPGSLDLWLKSQPDGYVENGYVNWLAISRLPKLVKDNNPISFDALEYYRENFQNNEHLTNDLMNDMPDILEVANHFVVAKGISSDSFTINDPYFNRNDLNSYGNSYLSLGRYMPTSSDLSYILLVTNQNLDIKVKDSLGNLVGEQYLQQPLKNDSNPGQLSGDPIKTYYYSKPETENYQIDLTSQIAQKYKIAAYFYDKDGNVNVLEQNGLIGPSKADSFIVNFDKLNSNTSKNTKIVTFQNLINDVSEAKTQKLISPWISNNLIFLVKNAKKNYDKGRRKIAVMELRIFEDIIRSIRKSSLIKEGAYQILLYDVKYLKTHL